MPSWQELQKLRAIEEVETICKVVGQALISICLALYAVLLNFQSSFLGSTWNRAHLVVHHQGIGLIYVLMAICAMGGVGGTYFAEFVTNLAPSVVSIQTVKMMVAIIAFWTGIFGIMSACCVEQQQQDQDREPVRSRRGQPSKTETVGME